MTSSHSPGHNTSYIDICKAAGTTPSLKIDLNQSQKTKHSFYILKRKITLKETMLKARREATKQALWVILERGGEKDKKEKHRREKQREALE